MSSSSSSDIASKPDKKHSFECATDRYIPPCFFARYGDPFLTLRHLFDSLVPLSVPDSLQKVVSANKKNSIKRTKSVRPHSTQIDRAERLAECAEEISKKLSERVTAFVAFVVRITRIKNDQQIQDLTTAAAHVLLDQSITRHPEFKRMNLCDASVVHAIGVCETKKQILTDSLADACGLKRANERCNEVIQFVGKWLLEACDNSAALIASVLPIVWLWDNDTLELLPEKELQNIYLRCRLDLPFLIIGLLDVLQLHRERDALILEVYQTFI